MSIGGNGVSKSKLVEEIKIVNQDKAIIFQGVDFVLSTGQVLDVVSGDQTLEDKEIRILETGGFQAKPGDKYLIFSDQYRGPLVSEELMFPWCLSRKISD